MPNGEKKGITVRIDADLHAEVSQYLRDHSMTMAEFVSLALDDELHPKNQMKEGNTMANTRTIAVQVPEDLFQRIKDYLQRNNMTQRQFLIGLIEDELEREMCIRDRCHVVQPKKILHRKTPIPQRFRGFFVPQFSSANKKIFFFVERT